VLIQPFKTKTIAAGTIAMGKGYINVKAVVISGVTIRFLTLLCRFLFFFLQIMIKY